MFDFLESTEIDLKAEKPDTSNLQRCFFDLEGSLNSSGDILQIAAIFTDWEFNITGAYNQYFKNTQEISSEEFNVHGISAEYLALNAKGLFSETFSDSPLYVDKPTMFISYTLFDVRRITQEVEKYRMNLIPFGTEVSSLGQQPNSGNVHFDAFRHGRMRGTKLLEKLGEDKVDQVMRELKKFGNFKKKGNHDALFDSALILALCRGL